jgi:hypothetical protein
MVLQPMATEKDLAFVKFLAQQTKSDKVSWEPTAEDQQFTASFKGKYNVIVDKSRRNLEDFYWLELQDANGNELLVINSDETNEIQGLFDTVQRKALNVDKALEEIMGAEIKDEDIPF